MYIWLFQNPRSDITIRDNGTRDFFFFFYTEMRLAISYTVLFIDSVIMDVEFLKINAFIK